MKKCKKTKQYANNLKKLLKKVKLTKKTLKESAINDLHVATEKTIKNLIYRKKGEKYDGMLGSLWTAVQTQNIKDINKILKSKSERGYIKSKEALEKLSQNYNYGGTTNDLEQFVKGIADAKGDIKNKTDSALGEIEEAVKAVNGKVKDYNLNFSDEDCLYDTKKVSDTKNLLDNAVHDWTQKLQSLCINGMPKKTMESLVALISINAYGKKLNNFTVYMDKEMDTIFKHAITCAGLSAAGVGAVFISGLACMVTACSLFGLVASFVFPPLAIISVASVMLTTLSLIPLTITAISGGILGFVSGLVGSALKKKKSGGDLKTINYGRVTSIDNFLKILSKL